MNETIATQIILNDFQQRSFPDWETHLHAFFKKVNALILCKIGIYSQAAILRCSLKKCPLKIAKNLEKNL